MKKTGGLRKRWLTNTFLVVVPLAILCTMVIIASFSMYYYSGMESDLRYRAGTTADFFEDYINFDYPKFYQTCVDCAQTYEDRNRIELQFIDAQGHLVASSYGPWAGRSPETPDISQAITTRAMSPPFLGKDSHTGQRVMAISAPLIYSNGEVIGVLRFVTATRIMDRQILGIAAITVFCCAVFLTALLITSNYYIRSVLMPIGQITETAKRIAGGSYGIQIQSRYQDEIGELADAINEMSVQINQNEKTQTEFISSLSHELRTPLTAITGWGETLLSMDSFDPVQTRRGMGIILREAERLTEMVVELLDFTRIEGGRIKLNMELTDIRSEFEDTVYMYGSRLRQQGIQLEYADNDEEIPELSCDPKRMRQVFLNILDNAAKYGGDGGRIDAEIHCMDGTVVIRIRDYGPGIPEDELPLVKKKFYKGSRAVRGTGIGLAVSDEIVQMHGGTLDLSNAPGGGTLVSVRLPISQ